MQSRRVRQDGRTASLHCVFVIHELCVFNDPPSCKTRTHSDIRGLTFLPCPLPAHVVQQRGVKVPLFEETGEWKTDGAKSGDGRHSWLRKQEFFRAGFSTDDNMGTGSLSAVGTPALQESRLFSVTFQARPLALAVEPWPGLRWSRTA